MVKLFFLTCAVVSCAIVNAQRVDVIPQPVSSRITEGVFVIDANTALKFNPRDQKLKAAAKYFSSYIKHISGVELGQNTGKAKAIELKISGTEETGAEGYLLSVKPSSIVVTANNKAGIVYAMQTLFQTLPAVRTNAALEVPAMEVKDYPRFKWRGMMLDVSRHFFSPEFVKEFIDLMALYKFNVFHWHLTDDQGWRIQIKKYPKLTSVGAWRVDETDKPWTERPQAKPGEKPTYGGFYTQDQIRDIVQYAAMRNITIVPEIEMPGHSAAAIAAYPFLSCSQERQLPMTGGNFSGVSSNYCAGNDSVFTFLQDVLVEVMDLFPSKYIHIGGDEVDKTAWKHCPKCQARIKAEGLKNEEELQSYFIKRVEEFIVSKNRKLIGWDEILEGGLAPEATVMSWRGEKGGIAAAKMHHDVVMTPRNPVYFDYYQDDPATEPLTIGGFNSLKSVYDYEPVPAELGAKEAGYVMGAQGNLWTEYITRPEYAEYMVLPRMLALAEVVWSPKGEKDWVGFNERLQNQFRRFDQQGFHYSRGTFKVEIQPVVQDDKLLVSLSTEAYKGEVYYTTDGSHPDSRSKRYLQPILIDTSLTLKAVTVVNGKTMNTVPSQQSFVVHKAVGKTVLYANPVDRSYRANGPNSLTDGIRGTPDKNKYWHGFSGKDLVATVDLGDAQMIHRLSIGCLQNYRQWIMMPEWVRFEVSLDGETFTRIATVSNDVPVTDQKIRIKDFSAGFVPRTARFVRVTAKVLDALPRGHSGEGRPAWLFADEIIVQ